MLIYVLFVMLSVRPMFIIYDIGENFIQVVKLLFNPIVYI